MFSRGPKLGNRKGATLAVVAVSLIAMLAVMALAIDLGMMYSARNEAQRVADAAALAGASAFRDIKDPFEAKFPAERRAEEYVKANYVLSSYVDLAETDIDADPGRQRVTVTVRREQIPTWFARMVGVNNVAVTAVAAAEVTNAGSATCVRPWAVQDLWFEQATNARPDLEGNDKYQPDSGDWYKPAEFAGDGSATGYGRSDTDNGMRIVLKSQKPGGNALAQPGPGEFMIWDMPEDPSLEDCAKGGNIGSKPYQYVNSICGCNNNTIYLGQEYDLKTGNVEGPSRKGYEGLMDKDPQAKWDEQKGMPCSPTYGCGAGSPRVVTIALMAPLPPGHWTHSTLNKVTFTNFAYLFVEDYKEVNLGAGNKVDQVSGRFMYYASGGNGHTTGPLVKNLRLVR